MAKFLTQEWLDEMCTLAQSIPPTAGVSARLQYDISGTPDGDVSFYWIIEDGVLAESKMIKLADAAATITATYDDAMQMWKGEADPQALFMQGRLKVSGDMGALLALMPLMGSGAYKTMVADLAAATTY